MQLHAGTVAAQHRAQPSEQLGTAHTHGTMSLAYAHLQGLEGVQVTAKCACRYHEEGRGCSNL
jgi:hypothetical protein